MASWLTEDGERKLAMPPQLENLGRGICPSGLMTLSAIFTKCHTGRYKGANAKRSYSAS